MDTDKKSAAGIFREVMPAALGRSDPSDHPCSSVDIRVIRVLLNPLRRRRNG